jgi:hypothetical protein
MVGNTLYKWSPIGPALKVANANQIRKIQKIQTADKIASNRKRTSSDVPNYKPTQIDFQIGLAVSEQKKWEAARQQHYVQNTTTTVQSVNQHTDNTRVGLSIGLNPQIHQRFIQEYGPSPIAPQQPSMVTTMIPFVGTYTNNSYADALEISGRDGARYRGSYAMDFATILPIARIGSVTLTAAKTGLANSRALGVAGEKAVGIGSKTRIPSLTGTAKYRIPDQLTSTTLGEIKNVSHLSLTRQLTDFHLYSQQNELQFILYTRPTTTFSGPLKNLINNGSIIVKSIPFR